MSMIVRRAVVYSYFILAVMIFSTNLLSMEEIKKLQSKLKIMTYNVCNFYNMESTLEAVHLLWNKRKDRIFDLILDEKPDIIGFQELRNVGNKSIIKDLWNGLSDDGYEIAYFKHNASINSYMNVIAYNAKKFALHETYHWWLSDTPYVLSDINENGWGNVALMLLLFPIMKQKKGDYNVFVYDYTCPIYVANVHNSLKHDIKLKTNSILIEEINKRTLCKHGIVILTGDFNTIDQQRSSKELAILENDGYKELLTNLRTKSNIKVSGTFIGYSFDKFKAKPGKLSGQLDHIFLKILPLSRISYYTAHSYVNVKRYNGNDNQRAITEKMLLEGRDGKENRDEFPSDHVPGIVELTLFFKE